MLNNWQQKNMTKISRRPVLNQNFTHQFEVPRIKLETPLLLKIHLFFFFCLLSKSDVNFNVSTTECLIIGKIIDENEETCSYPKLDTSI